MITSFSQCLSTLNILEYNYNTGIAGEKRFKKESLSNDDVLKTLAITCPNLEYCILICETQNNFHLKIFPHPSCVLNWSTPTYSLVGWQTNRSINQSWYIWNYREVSLCSWLRYFPTSRNIIFFIGLGMKFSCLGNSITRKILSPNNRGK